MENIWLLVACLFGMFIGGTAVFLVMSAVIGASVARRREDKD